MIVNFIRSLSSWKTITGIVLLQGKKGNFKRYNVSVIDSLGTQYDYGSVMHYGTHFFAKNKTKPTIKAKQSGVRITTKQL